MSDGLSRLSAALDDRYTIERELGAGGMATVYLAHDLKHDRKVAVKVLREDLSASLGKERFLREIRIAAALQHPHVLPLYDSGEAAGLLYYVMPFVDGQSLRQKLVREGELPVGEAVRILRDVADALGEAHRSGVVHRDLKPENVMLRGRHALVTDFGVAKAVSEATGRHQMTTMGVALGTPAYMSPEQATADPHVDHRADVYAFGVLAYELLTGHPPFTGNTPQQVLAAHVTSAATPVTTHRSTLPPVLALLVMRCLEKKPADRPQSAEELVLQLEAVLTPSGGLTPTETRPLTGVTLPGLRTGTWGAAAAGIVLVLAALMLWLSRASPGSSAPGGNLSIAVLYIENLSRDTADQYLADGLTEDLSTGLGRVGRLQVKAPSAVRRVQETNRGDLTRIGQALAVRYILEGSLRRTSTGVRVSARLVEHASETQAWSNTYDATTSSLLDLPAQIARDVGSALTGGLNRDEIAAASERPTSNAEAYDAWMRGNFFLSRRTPEAAEAAHRQYGRAISLDPGFTRALVRDAHVYVQQVDYGWTADGVSGAATLQRALAILDRALRLDSTISEAWTARAYALTASTPERVALARAAAERAVALDSANLEAQNRLGWVLMQSGDFAGAARQGRAVLALDPSSFLGYRLLGEAAYFTGRASEALAMYDSAVLLAPTSVGVRDWRARIRLSLGDTTGALTDATENVRLGSTATWLAPYIQAVKGNPDPARRWLATNRTRRDPIDLSLVLLGLGERSQALDELTARESAIPAFRQLLAPEYSPISNDPRFQVLVERVRARVMVR
jgi:serine/threonine-protein kinase